METHLELFNKSYNDVLTSVSNKFGIYFLKIIGTPMATIEKDLINEFSNLIDLNLSNCSLTGFEDGAFNKIIHLKSINLSNNCLSSIDKSLFETNTKLKIIILQNNLLNFPNIKFSLLEDLDILDLSYNRISKLIEDTLNFANLKVLYLNCNQIQSVMLCTFYQLPKLTHLTLEHNELNELHQNTFDQLKELQFLNLNHNYIETLPVSIFWILKELKGIYLKSNLLKDKISRLLFFYNVELVEIDLSGNKLSAVKHYSFENCVHVMSLSLKIRGSFQVYSIKKFEFLTKFELFYESDGLFYLTGYFWNTFKDLNSLKTLILIFQKVQTMKMCVFPVNLEHLHIECKEPNDNELVIRLSSALNWTTKLKKLVLKNLNSFTITKFPLKCDLTYLDLRGINNCIFDYEFNTFTNLEHLNLSFSGLVDIREFVFIYLVNLQHLDVSHTQITTITSVAFQNNRKLRYLNCSHCLIETIEDWSFQYLHNLVVLDLSHNRLLSISTYALFGLRDTCVKIL